MLEEATELPQVYRTVLSLLLLSVIAATAVCVCVCVIVIVIVVFHQQQHTKCKKEAIEHVEDPGVPAFVFLIQKRIHKVAQEQWEQRPRQVLKRHLQNTQQRRYMLEDALTVQYSTVQYSTAQHSTAQHSTVQHSTVQYSTAQRITIQHSTFTVKQHITSHHSAVQHSTLSSFEFSGRRADCAVL